MGQPCIAFKGKEANFNQTNTTLWRTKAQTAIGVKMRTNGIFIADCDSHILLLYNTLAAPLLQHHFQRLFPTSFATPDGEAS